MVTVAIPSSVFTSIIGAVLREFEMKGDLRAIDEFADALALVSETMDESPNFNAINRLGRTRR
jgi:hypothetical protein